MRGPDRYYISAVIALDLVVAMVVAGVVGVLVGGPTPRRELAIGGAGTAAVALALRLQNRQLQASTKDVLLLVLVATTLTAWAAVPELRRRGRAGLPAVARAVGAVAGASAVGMVVATRGAIAPVVHARGWATLGAVVVAVVGLVAGARGARSPVAVLAAASLGTRLAVGLDGRPAAGWLGLLALTALASWTSTADRQRARAAVRTRGAALAHRTAAARERGHARRAAARSRRAERRATIAPAPLHALADLSPRARWLGAALGVAGAAVVVLVTARARHLGWYPIGDDAIIATRAGDVGGRHTPILGMPTTLGPLGPQGLEVRHPGPILF
ncbi:MAG: hypothetical protein KF703_19885, partial [Actinobacteria bacterium]|nr:hypothetical protein [Actinomycetota bacterium]